jgi:WD40 repeat protein
MSRLFLSYAHADVSTAHTLRDALTAQGYVAVFRDHDPLAGIPAGTLWAHELLANLERCDVVVFLASKRSLASPWCFTELALAVARGLHVVQVGVEVVGAHPVLTDRQMLATATDVAGVADALVRDLSRVGFPPSDPFTWDPERPPYPGLRRFTREHAAVLFGRDREIQSVMARLTQPRPAPVLVVGPSGSGKSSLVRAGVLPRLEAQKSAVVVPVIEPGRNPLQRVAAGVASADSGLNFSRLVDDPRALAEAVDRLSVDGRRVVLVLDQAEDLLGRAEPAEAEELASRLADVDQERLAVVVVLRSASLDAVLRDPRLRGLAAGEPIWVRPLDRSSLREVIVGPARLAGIRFEPPELVDRILDDAGDGYALPLLAALLEELTRDHSRRSPTIVTRDRYEVVGPVRRIVERRADDVTRELRNEYALGESAVVDAYLRLVDVDPDWHLIRSEVRVDELPPDQVPVFAALERHRLVIRDRRVVGRSTTFDDPANRGDIAAEGVDVVTPIHEEVFRAWPALASAIDAQRRDLEVRSWLRREAEAWSNSGGGAVPLTGGRLAVAVEWWERNGLASDDAMTRYITAAVRQRRRRRVVTVAAPVLAVLVLVVGTLATQLARQVGVADRARSNAEALRLAGEARSALGTRPDLSLLLSLEAMARGDDLQVQWTPFVALTRGPGPRSFQQLPEPVQAAALDDAGEHAVLVTANGTMLWETSVGQMVGGILPLASVVALSGDGSTLALARGDRVEIRHWQLARSGVDCLAPGGDVEQVRLSPHADRMLAVAVNRGTVPPRSTVTILNPDSCRTIVHREISGLVADVALDAPGNRVALALVNEKLGQAQVPVSAVQVWQPSSGLPFDDLASEFGSVRAVAIAGDHVGGLTADGTLALWDLRTPSTPPAEIRTLPTPGVALRPIALDGTQWLAAGQDGELRLVRPTARQAVGPALISLPRLGYSGDVAPLAVAGNLNRTLTVDPSGRLVTWELDSATALGAPVEPDSQLYALAPLDGTTLAMGIDGLLSIPPGRGGVTRRPIPGPTTLTSAGGAWAVGTQSGEVLMAQSSTGIPTVITHHSSPVRGLAILDGATVASVDASGDLRVTSVSGVGESVQLGTEVRSIATNGRLLFVGTSDGTLLVADPKDLTRKPTRIQAHQGDLSAIAVSPDGRSLATGGDDRVIVIWDVAASGHLTQRLRLVGHSDRITSLSFSPDGRLLASGSEDHTVILWDPNRGEQLGEPTLMPVIPAVAFDPYHTADNSLQLDVAAQGLARWPMTPRAWTAIACRIIGSRALDEAERQRFLRGSAPAAHC